jgi:formylmethanofuran dehydrogenase subunit A
MWIKGGTRVKELLVKGVFVYDPSNNIDGDKMDIAVKNGKIVRSVNLKKAKIIDASNMIAMPGGIDIHSHICGTKVNAGRLLRPEDHVRDVEVKTSVTRSGVGRSVPSTFVTGYRYAIMGYTTVMEPATPPLETRHTHEEFNDTPIIDKACFPLFGSNWFVMDFLKRGEVDECASYVSWVLNAIKGYAIKLVNPGGNETWAWGKNIRYLDDKVYNFDITPRDIIRGLCKVNKLLNLPSPIHVHAISLGVPGNYEVTLETLKSVEDLGSKDKPALHLSHIQFNAFAGTEWRNLSSGAAELADYVNENDHITTDLGQIIFTDTTTMTADGPWQYCLHWISKNKWVNHDVETETGGGIVPYRYKRKSYVNAVQWAIALEYALQVKDPWKVCLTTDHPNGGPFTEYPLVMTWLLSRKARSLMLRRVNKRAKQRCDLENFDREYSLYELAVTTRSGPAKILGLNEKGHLGIGADADIAIYKIDPSKLDSSKDYKKVTKAFRKAAYTIKDGLIVAKDGEVVKSLQGRTFWSKTDLSREIFDQTTSYIKEKFEDYYTVQLENYVIDESYLGESAPISVKAKI